MKTFLILLKNEFRINVRDMNMIVFAIIMPAVVLIVLGLLYQTQPAFAGADYTFLEQSFGAVSAISIIAGGLMGLLLVIADYRERKILKRFQVTPVSPVMLLAVEFTIYILYAVISMALLFVIAAVFWDFTFHGSVWAFIGSWLLTLFSTLSIGLLVGGVAKNAKIASVIASALYFPMLVFSGTTLPYEAMPEMMQKITLFFPLTQGIQLMKTTSLGLPDGNAGLPIAVMGAVTLICMALAVRCFRWE